ncbi:hypothetical protein ASPFODRAFT_215438 [Aspergillus luchuensis CBS 106.47]|uniref:Uncharacterized protein n=1 Tax=Aspergillus luchuensis (strain CBS 106.47) TaxID=1137211 RepID=A0A1M3TXE6_ASPLC|nr:hypothetical protein ASPFODRAFT_215438 [Aspergillus luchuensis CBS 106.47]
MPIPSRIITSITSRIFLGPNQGRNEEWLRATVEYTKNLFLTGMALRFFPSLSQTPCRSTAAVLPQSMAECGDLSSHSRRDNILQWMMDAATGQEAEPEDLAQQMLILSVTSIPYRNF